MIRLKRDSIDGGSIQEWAEKAGRVLDPGTETETRVNGPDLEVPCDPEWKTKDGIACCWDGRFLNVPQQRGEVKNAYKRAWVDGQWLHQRITWYRIPKEALDEIL